MIEWLNVGMIKWVIFNMIIKVTFNLLFIKTLLFNHSKLNPSIIPYEAQVVA